MNERMISVASGFQYSVNIGYDLNSDEKLVNFIPTKSALELIEEVLLSTRVDSTERARVLIGAYGKGKSHIVLTIMALMMKRNLHLFDKLLPKIDENPGLSSCVENYYESNNKILPVVITGSNTSLTQAFLMALQRTLVENDLMDIMPETNYKAAIHKIESWRDQFPGTYENFKNALEIPVKKFITELEDYNISAYETFERIYPTLTAGSIFNPFLGFDVAELYEGVVKSLKSKGYTGIYVIYDEFSKFLEANIAEASVSDTKMLQDFAEKCNRSGNMQMHLMLISHKEISNYIDTLPKHKVDGWRGVSERFKHVHLTNNFSQTYEIIATVIQKNPILWESFCKQYHENFDDIIQRYAEHSIFGDMEQAEIDQVIQSCYPLHPISMFILPRLSEYVAQNERTLFTFLSANGAATLPRFLETYDEKIFKVVTPDVIYDYFEPLFKKEVYSSDLYKTYQLTTAILAKVEDQSLEGKIIKTLSLVYILGQFEKLVPTRDEIVGIYSVDYTVPEIETAIDHLISEEFVIYLKRSNNYLRLKQTSGVDIHQKIHDTKEIQRGRLSVKEVLNSINFDNYMYPSRYNDEREMTRYYSFVFIDESEVSSDTNWRIKGESIPGDGVIYGILPSSQESLEKLKDNLLISSGQIQQAVFVLPKNYTDISSIIAEFKAVSTLCEISSDDKVLFDEYEVVYEDLKEVINSFIKTYTQPEQYKARYIYQSKERNIGRKAALTALLSDICDDVFALTPVINNEAVNKDEITKTANNSCGKIISGLLRNDLENGLGLMGTGQEVSIMRSTLIRTGVLIEEAGVTSINLQPEDVNLFNVFRTIVDFIRTSNQTERTCWADLYHQLTNPEYHIGLRKGLIPIYIAVVLHEYKKSIIIEDRFGQVPVSTDVLMQINAEPTAFFIKYLNWNSEKEAYVTQLAEIFEDYVIEAEKVNNTQNYAVMAMDRWYKSLPKCARELKRDINGERIDRRYIRFLNLLRQNHGSYELLFQKLPEVFGGSSEELTSEVIDNISVAKEFYDNALVNLKYDMVLKVKMLFARSHTQNLEMHSLASVIKDWYESLDVMIHEKIFPDGTEKCLVLFRSITNDEEMFITKLAKVCTDLRMEDWDDTISSRFMQRLEQYKTTAEEYHSQVEQLEIESQIDSDYQITYVDDNGNTSIRKFDRVEISKRGKMLLNAINADIKSMGHSISEQEKRQILMEVLQKMC